MMTGTPEPCLDSQSQYLNTVHIGHMDFNTHDVQIYLFELIETLGGLVESVNVATVRSGYLSDQVRNFDVVIDDKKTFLIAHWRTRKT
jgi:hypothetical protein